MESKTINETKGNQWNQRQSMKPKAINETKGNQ